MQTIGSSWFTHIVEIRELIRKEKLKCTYFLRQKAILGIIHTTTLFFFTSRQTCILKQTKKSFWQPTTEDTTRRGSPLKSKKVTYYLWRGAKVTRLHLNREETCRVLSEFGKIVSDSISTTLLKSEDYIKRLGWASFSILLIRQWPNLVRGTETAG